MTKDPGTRVERALAGDRSAFSRLVEKHQRLALSVAFSVLTDAHLAADAVQDAFVKAYMARSQLRDPDRFLPWFLTIVRSTATDLVRKRVRWGRREVPLGERDSGDEVRSGNAATGIRREPPDALLEAERSTRIRAALQELPEGYREVILLKHLEGHSYRDIARMLKTTVRAVESRLFRARQQLSQILERADVETPRPESTVHPGPVNGRRLAPGSDAIDRTGAPRGDDEVPPRIDAACWESPKK